MRKFCARVIKTESVITHYEVIYTEADLAELGIDHNLSLEDLEEIFEEIAVEDVEQSGIKGHSYKETKYEYDGAWSYND